MILLVNDGLPQQVALSEGLVAGERTVARVYAHEGKYLAVDGLDHVVLHDSSEILSMQGYRLADAAEQQEYASKKKKSRSIRETSVEVGG